MSDLIRAGQHHIVHAASLVVHISDVRARACWKCGLINFFAGLGFAVVVVLIVAKHYRWLI